MLAIIGRIMETPKSYREKRPWGAFTQLSKNTPSTVKLLTINPGEALSLQRHAERDEFWKVISGEGFATIGSQRLPAKVDAEFFIPRGTNHRLESGASLLTVLEISFGDFEDEDIVRLEDRYGRASEPNPHT
jgi:mannose-6-phosphate isomerase-like protein (cupin superfamily)